MTTAQDVVTGSLKLMRIVAEGETPRAELSADGLTVLNDLMFAFPTMGIDYTHSTLALTDGMPIGEEHVRGLKAMLAKEWMPQFGGEVAPAVATLAEDGLRTLQTSFEQVQEIAVDNALLNMPSQYWGLRR